MRTFTRFTIIALAALAAFGASSAQASADMLFVCAEAGACQYSSIQAAVDAADGSDTIRVRSGTYDEAVTIPAGKTGLTLVGAQAGVAANVGDRPLSGEESVLSAGAGGIALRVNSSRVTIDGFVIRDSAEGVRSDAETSGLRVVNSAFVANDNSIVPDSTGDLQTVIEHNTFLETRATYAIFTRKSRGRLVVSENRIEAGRLVGIIALPSRDVTVRGNRGTGGDILAVLGNVEGGLIEDNVVNNTDGLALLSGTRDVTVRSNILSSSGRRFGVVLSRELGTSSETTIEGNDFSGSKELEAIYVDYHSLSDTLVARYNRFAPNTRGVRAGGDQRVDARYNWWGCNEGPGAAGCARRDESRRRERHPLAVAHAVDRDRRRTHRERLRRDDELPRLAPARRRRDRAPAVVLPARLVLGGHAGGLRRRRPQAAGARGLGRHPHREGRPGNRPHGRARQRHGPQARGLRPAARAGRRWYARAHPPRCHRERTQDRRRELLHRIGAGAVVPADRPGRAREPGPAGQCGALPLGPPDRRRPRPDRPRQGEACGSAAAWPPAATPSC